MASACRGNSAEETISGVGDEVSEASSDSETEKDNSTANTQTESGTDETDEVSYVVSNTTFSTIDSGLGNKYYNAVVEITNTGTKPIYIHGGVFEFEDNDGHLLKSDDMISNCPSIVQPGEMGYFYENAGVLDGIALDNGINLKPSFEVDKAKGECAVYEVSDTNLRSESMGSKSYPVVSGRLTNNLSKDENMPYVYVVYFDTNNVPISIDFTTGTSLKANGGTGSFECSGLVSPVFYEKTVEDIATYKVIAQEGFHMQF